MPNTLVYMGSRRVLNNESPAIKVIGIGAAGTNIIGGLYGKRVRAELIAINTDWTQLSAQPADQKFIIGMEETRGFGCGGDVAKGRAAARESIHRIRPALDSELIFLVGGLGNGTATGGLPVIADEAKKKGALVVAFLVAPFFMNNSQKEKTEVALQQIKEHVDTALVLDLNRLTEVYANLPLVDAFTVMNSIVATSINSLISLIRGRELMEINFSELKTILSKGGFGTIGISVSEGDSSKLLETALSNQLFHYSPKDAKAAIVHVIGNKNLSLSNVNDVAGKIHDFTEPDAEVLIGAKTDVGMGDAIKALVILTGMESAPLKHSVKKSVLK